ncbi:deoxyribose-phosphate aldolase [Ureaplasma miroungigenitalium]|uniref:Deoxyribose-phosphate aldolase n=1 Tax=Ureaplasma miroungigenitalium TaxID=1042321 RepID=A0ABT3BN43_9BACT|nr:deoxyribose-phosphate aldolase [Ureaplasma miroungigenitalium]MCV3728641.1 deoxyribose-phosphate aldolase [Ureaplasma miroungigenitalium]MCV3734332.1 deoxyribose-phosphate aldolase [Ureaplasma miroungigenitalium]
MNKYSKYIDHTLLKNEATFDDINDLVNEAIEYDFFSVCIQPFFVKYAKHLLLDQKVKITTVIGFPLGMNTIATKVFEAKQAIQDGADEIDMVININELRSQNFEYCLSEINQIKQAIGDHVLKVIVETALLDHDTKVFAANLILASNADFIKTSTGFASSGAVLEDVILWKEILGDQKEIKAAGGVKNIDDLEAFIKHGATRIGTSSAIKILKNAKIGESDY